MYCVNSLSPLFHVILWIRQQQFLECNFQIKCRILKWESGPDNVKICFLLVNLRTFIAA